MANETGWIGVDESAALRDFWSVYDASYEEILVGTLVEARRHPEFGPLVEAMPAAQQEERNRMSRELLRRAIEDGAWQPYDADLRAQGSIYAQLGISFAGWYDIVRSFQKHIVPRLVAAYGAEPARLSAALIAMQRFIDRAMVMIGEQYLETKQAALRASEAENVRVQEVTRAKSDFLAMMSHELRTPLNSIIGFSEVLVDEQMGELNVRQLRYVKNINESGRHLLHLINDLLDLSKIEAGRLDVAVETCGVGPLLDQVVATVRPIADRRHVTIELCTDASLPPVFADTVRLKQVLYNLLSNAIKFSKADGRVEIVTSVVAGSVRISVRDAGIGIAAEDLPRLFSPFTQLQGGERAEGSGTGLGLAVSKQLVELMGGAIGVTSALGAGSTFFFDLRIAAVGAAASPPSTGTSRSGLALIVDDEANARELIDIIMREEGFRTVHAVSGEEALRVARELRPDVITLDVLLPGADGWEILRRLREDALTTTIPVVMVSISSDRSTALSLGAVEHLVKPIERAALLAALARRGLVDNAEKRTIHVLAIDDDPKHLDLVTAALTPHGFRVLTATTGRGGVEVALTHPVDLLLLDLVLPDISGVEVARALRAEPRTRGLPILLVTAHELSATDRARLNGDVAAVLAKGELGVDGLRDTIHRALVERGR